MVNNELERVKEDIEVIKEAAGFELPFGWDSALVSLVLLPAMGVGYLVYYLFSDEPSRFAAIAIGVVLFIAMGYLRFRYRKSTGRSAIKRREYGFCFYGDIAIGAIAIGYLIWAKHIGLEIAYVAGGIILMIGIMGILMAFQAKGKLYHLGESIPLMLFGISLLIWTTPSVVVINACITLVIGGLATGAIQVYQLKHEGVEK